MGTLTFRNYDGKIETLEVLNGAIKVVKCQGKKRDKRSLKCNFFVVNHNLEVDE